MPLPILINGCQTSLLLTVPSVHAKHADFESLLPTGAVATCISHDLAQHCGSLWLVRLPRGRVSLPDGKRLTTEFWFFRLRFDRVSSLCGYSCSESTNNPSPAAVWQDNNERIFEPWFPNEPWNTNKTHKMQNIHIHRGTETQFSTFCNTSWQLTLKMYDTKLKYTSDTTIRTKEAFKCT